MTLEKKAPQSVQEELLREQVRLTFEHLPTMQVTSVLVALVLAYVVRTVQPQANVWGWLLMIGVIAASRIVLFYRFRRVRDGSFAGKYWKNLFMGLAHASGWIWGLSAFIIFPAHNLELISLFVLVMASLSTATTISHTASRFAPAAWAVPAMGLYAMRCLLEGGTPEYALALLIALYLFTILHYSFTQNRTITSAISVKFENRELLEEASRLAAIVESTDDAIVGKTLDGIITSWNSGAERLYGFTKEEALGQPLSFIIPPQCPDDYSMILDKIRRGERIDHYETLRKRKDGGIVNVSLTSSPIKDSSGKTIGISTIARDIMARKKAAEERERLIGELQSALSRVKTLSGLLPICASCKKIRDDRGYWNQIEGYIRSHAEVEFTHGICPDCLSRLYPEYSKDT